MKYIHIFIILSKYIAVKNNNLQINIDHKLIGV